MALPPQKFREIVFQILYSRDFLALADETALMLMGELKVTKRAVLEAAERVCQLEEHLQTIDSHIQTTSTGYSFDRISRVEKTILRIGLYEILYDPSIPPKVAIAEAIRLTKKFATRESAHFVNAILDGVYQHELAATGEPLPQ